MDKLKIIKMLEYCGVSYRNDQPEDKNTKLIFINDKVTDVQCYIRLKEDTAIITFRGSDSKKDFKTDFKFWKSVVPYKNYNSRIRVHAGFISTYKSNNVRGKIHKIIDCSIKNVCVTGHSYGAALAILCAIDLEYNYPKKDYEVIVFGCPKVGNRAFRDSYNLRIFKTLRIENKWDIVPKIPFSILGYRHVGCGLKIKKPGFYNPFSLKNHALQEYYSAVWDF